MTHLISLILALTFYLGIDFIHTSNIDPVSTKGLSSGAQKSENYLGNKARSLFDWKGTGPLITKIKNIQRQENQRMVFLLENRQIWIQLEPRQQPFKEGELVSIKASLLGGFNMESRSGINTLVRRIQ